MERNNNNGQPPADGRNIPAQADGVIIPPAQQMNQQLPARTFGGTPNENARQHLKSFLEICNSFKIHRVSNDVLKLKLFPYSLRDKAKTWLNNLQPGSLQSWTQKTTRQCMRHGNDTEIYSDAAQCMVCQSGRKYQSSTILSIHRQE
ncbi:hypothetical protein V6N12_074768 [Hibiscus sabdariffa]|uniref:Retrotransposon gag domain-containing protein n=1 Tax=Hibiscus sabdariffa TaxID=183260 RepID=A0ABR2D2C7_9ROSI